MNIEIKNPELTKILEERGTIFKQLTAVNEKLVEYDNERKKLGLKMDRLKEKTKIIMDKLNPKLKEFEIVTQVFLKDGKAYYEISDVIELYKESIRAERKAKK
jgi:hypothetical protein